MADTRDTPLDALSDDEEFDFPLPNDDEQRRIALQIFLDAWDDALAEGVDPDVLANTAIFAAFSDMVETYGEESVAELADGLRDRVRQGEFTLNQTRH
ncbi:MAG: hypothetical protein P1U84_04715 [Parvibaculaceae bacterium]|nr:hypothetical protein [Parvibaculaceae bacterium]|tara:strand:+ start:762 stop:1055 length:294 start_codon:yes stop_codon:yes gene_type:complete